MSDSVLRHGIKPGLIRYESIFGDQVSLLVGEPSIFFGIFHLGFIVLAGVLLLFSLRFYYQQNNVVSLALAAFLTSVLAITIIGFKIDKLELPLFYIGGLPFTLISLVVALMLSLSYRHNEQELVHQRLRQRQLELTFERLARGASIKNAADFYPEMLNTLYELSQADFIFIGVTDPDDHNRIITKAVLKSGFAQPNFTYSIANTPSEQVPRDNLYSVQRGISARFSNAETSENTPMEGFVGISIKNAEQQTIGLIAVYFAQPDMVDKPLEQALQVISTRAAAESYRDQLEQRLRSMAYRDYLSNLPNRASLLEAINTTFIEAIRTDTNALLILIDLDHFGEINRKYGYEIGDQVIHTLGNRFTAYSSENVFIARNGGDDFAVILTNLEGDYQALIKVHWAALKAIIQDPVLIGRRKISVQCSAGAVIFPQQVDKRFDVIGSAEHALQQAKEKGRNQYSLFAPQMLAIKDADRAMEEDLSKAMRAPNELSMVYQPKVDCQGHLIGAEALLRWHHPVSGFI